jgi:hypothetical protein
VLGGVVGAGEYRHGTIAWTLLVTPKRLRAVMAQVLACAAAGLAAALGAGLGSLLRNQVAAVVIVLVMLFVVDPTLAAVDEDIAAFTLTGLGIAISGGDDSTDLLAPGLAGLVWALYALLFTTLAAIRTARRDS